MLEIIALTLIVVVLGALGYAGWCWFWEVWDISREEQDTSS